MAVDINFIDFLQKEAKILGNSAAHNGAYNDGGQKELERQVQAWMAGRAGQIPSFWESYMKKYRRETDPEFKEYIRLKEKFG